MVINIGIKEPSRQNFQIYWEEKHRRQGSFQIESITSNITGKSRSIYWSKSKDSATKLIKSEPLTVFTTHPGTFFIPATTAS